MIGYIYKTTNLKNGKIYIGKHSAETFEPDRYIGSGCLFKKILERDGKENFKCELLKECFTIDELNESEKYYIKKYNSQDRSIGYNIADGGDEPWNRSKKMTVQYCKKDAEAQRNLAPNVNCYDLQNGLLFKTFNSCMDAAEFLNLPGNVKTIASRIHTVCVTKKGHAYGYIWRFEKDYVDIFNLSENELASEHSNPRARAIQQLDLNDNLIAEFDSAAAYSKTITDDYKRQRHIAKSVNHVCLGKAKTYKNYRWKFKNIN